MTERYDVSNRGLTEVPDEIRAMRELRELYIYDNQLSTLPGWIGEHITTPSYDQPWLNMNASALRLVTKR